MFDKVFDLAERFGAIDAVRDALLSQPDKSECEADRSARRTGQDRLGFGR